MSCPSGSYTVSTVGPIAASAFENCDSLTSVIIGDSVTSIGKYAFYNCDSLSSVTIGDSVTSIGTGPFAGCSSLVAMSVSALNKAYASVGGVLFTKNVSVLVQFPGGVSGSYTVPNSVTSIGAYAFCDCDALSSVTGGV